MAAYPDRALAKVGADGVYGVALLERGLGIALKVEDGHARAAMTALVRVLEQLGLEPDPAKRLRRFASFPIRNTRDERVGVLEAAGALSFE
jgi:L-asparaginase II